MCEFLIIYKIRTVMWIEWLQSAYLLVEISVCIQRAETVAELAESHCVCALTRLGVKWHLLFRFRLKMLSFRFETEYRIQQNKTHSYTQKHMRTHMHAHSRAYAITRNQCERECVCLYRAASIIRFRHSTTHNQTEKLRAWRKKRENSRVSVCTFVCTQQITIVDDVVVMH